MANLFILSFIISILYIILGLYVWLKNHKGRVNRLFIILSIVLAIVVQTDFAASLFTDLDSYIFSLKIFHLIYLSLAIIYPWFIFEFINFKPTKIIRYVHFILVGLIGYIIGLTDWVFSKAEVTDYGYSYIPGPFQIYYISYILVIFLYSFYQIIKYLHNCKKASEINRTKYLISGVILIFISLFLDTLRRQKIFILIDYPTQHIAYLLFFFLSAYAIVKLKLMHINVIYRKSIIYSLMSAFIAVFFELLTWLADKIIMYMYGTESNLVSILAVIICAFSFEPIKEKVTNFVNKLL